VGAAERDNAHLTDVDRSRAARGGIRPVTDRAGLDLFDAALRTGQPAVIPVPLDFAILRA
jgi:hypothetical protein